MDNERAIAIKALVGSHNYHMNDEHSDKDYKYFVFPTWDDVYNGSYYTHSVVSDIVDYTVHDIRKLPELLYKTNINFLEVLFSGEVSYCPDLKFLFDRREDIARMNLSYLKKACIGMSYEKEKRLHKFNDDNRWMENKYGYNTKEACHAIRVLDTCLRYKETGFTDFNAAFSYQEPNIADTFMSIKRGEWLEEDVLNTIHEKRAQLDALKEFNRIPDETLYGCINERLKNIIWNHISAHT